MKSLNIIILAAICNYVSAADNPWETYPSILKTATINGFADPIYDVVPSCAQPCLSQEVGVCPYWDTGCLCVMRPFADPVGMCVAENCKGTEVDIFTSAAYSICSKVGAWEPYWIPRPDAISALESAASVRETPAETTPEPEPTETPVETAEEPTKPTEEPTKPTEPTEEPSKPTEEPSKPTEEPSGEPSEKPSEEPSKEPVEPTESKEPPTPSPSIYTDFGVNNQVPKMMGALGVIGFIAAMI